MYNYFIWNDYKLRGAWRMAQGAMEQWSKVRDNLTISFGILNFRYYGHSRSWWWMI